MSKSEHLTTILRSIIACSGIGIVLIASSVLGSYGVELFQTGNIAALSRTEMAPHTALCFFLVGIACVCGALLWRFSQRE